MLYLTFSDRFDSVGCGVTLHPTYPNVPNALHVIRVGSHNYNLYCNDFQPGWRTDRKLFGTSIDLDCLIGEYDAWKLTRIYQPSGNSPVLVMGNRSVVASRHYDSHKDGGSYGSLLGAITALDGLTATYRRDLWSRESDVLDTSARGALQLSSSSKHYYPDRINYSIYGNTYSIYSTAGGKPGPQACRTKLTYELIGPGDGLFTVYPSGTAWSGNYHRVDLDDFVRPSGKTIVFPSWASGYARNTMTYSDFQVVCDGDIYEGTFLFKYHFLNEATTTRIYGGLCPTSVDGYDVEIRVDYLIVPRSAKYTSFTEGLFPIDVEESFTVSRHYTSTYSWCNFPLPDGYGYTVGSGELIGGVTVSPLQILHKPGTSKGGFDDLQDSVPLLKRYRESYQLRKFRSFIDELHPDIRPASALSANDCMSSYVSSTNLLESLPDLPGLLSLVKDVSRFGHLIQQISAGNPAAIPEAVDLMADSYLAYTYGIKPTLSDIQESKRIAWEYYERMDVLSKDLPSSLYGKFHYAIPASMQDLPGRLEVTVRTKLVLRSSPGGLLAYAITLDNVGLFPTLARVWDLVPFSFVLDWFTSLGDRFADIDHFVARVGLDVDYYIHTYLYEYELDTDTYTPFRRRSQSSEKPQFRYFIRERSLWTPVMRQRRFDFHPPRGVGKHLFAAGSLLWSS